MRDLSDEGGRSDAELRELASNRVAADAVFLIRVLVNDEASYAMEIMSLVGTTHAKMSVDNLFDMWVRLAAYLVRDATADATEETAKKKRFCLTVLHKLTLDEHLQGLVRGLEEAMEKASDIAQAPASTPPRSDEGPTK